MADCIFCKVRNGEMDSHILFRDDRCFVIRDINPTAPTHLLIIPNQHIVSLAYIGPGQEPLIGHMFAVAEELARREGIALTGFRLVMNQGPDAGQSVSHLHMHLLGGNTLRDLG